MFYGKIHEQTILEISQGDHIEVTADSFLIDRQARELSRHTLKFYREFLRRFIRILQRKLLDIHTADYARFPAAVLSRVWRKT